MLTGRRDALPFRRPDDPADLEVRPSLTSAFRSLEQNGGTTWQSLRLP